MSRKPKPKNTLSAGQRAAIYEKEQKRRTAELSELNTGEAEKDNTAETEPEVKNAEPIQKKKKEKPQTALVNVDLSVKAGKLAALHGICNGPLSPNADVSSYFKAVNIPCVRFDKTEGVRGGYAVDISKIFPNLDADERNPENYSFRETDKYIIAAANVGAKIIYRLGESFDYGTPDKKLTLCGNYDKITSVCVNIIRHYNNYWCGGFALDIKYFEVLSHTDMPIVRENNPDESIFELYTRIANGIKLYDDTLLVGGMSFSRPSQLVRDFIKYCKKKNAPIDFLSVSVYSGSVEAMGEQIEEYLHLLKNSSYSDAELIVSEWGYLPDADAERVFASVPKTKEQSERKRELVEKQGSVFGAAFVASALLNMLQYPDIKTACLYCGEAGSLYCPLFDAFGLPKKPYYAFESISRLAGRDTVFCMVQHQPEYAHSGIYAAACSAQKEAYIMLSAFDGCTSIDLRLDSIPDDFYTADIYMLDGVKNMELCHSVQLAGMKKRMVMSVSPYSVILIKLY